MLLYFRISEDCAEKCTRSVENGPFTPRHEISLHAAPNWIEAIAGKFHPSAGAWVFEVTDITGEYLQFKFVLEESTG